MNARLQQVGGDHYLNKSVQPWDAMESWMSHEEFCGYLRGCAIKYIARYKEKGGIEDLRKAQHYLAKLIEVEEAWASADTDHLHGNPTQKAF